MLKRYLDALGSPELQSFLIAHENDDKRTFVLKYRDIHGIPAGIVADQLSGRQKAKVKLPTFYKNINIVYPPSVNLEQCSSELTARYKSTLLQQCRAKGCGLDLTGGFGVDSYFMSQFCASWDYVEADHELLSIAKHNHEKLGAPNIHHHAMTAEQFLRNGKSRFDFVFLDPSRRVAAKKVFRLSDCEPDPVRLLPLIFRRSDNLLLKASPLLDLQQGVRELKTVQKIFVVAVDNECKEILFLCHPSSAGEPPIICINLREVGEADEFDFTFKEEREAVSRFSAPLTYLYEPHSWILKAGAFKIAGNRFGLFKLHPSTHLYTSDDVAVEFPGKVFRIEMLDPDPRKVSQQLPEGKANVLVRNYPLSPEQIKVKFKIHDGGSKFLIGFSGQHKKYLVIADRIK